MALTHKQREFCRLVVSGSTLADAYRGISPGIKDTSARTAGAKLHQKPEIKDELKRLHAEITSRTVVSMLERRYALADIIRGKNGFSEIKVADLIRAIELDAKLSGDLKEIDSPSKPSQRFGLSLTANNMQINNGVDKPALKDEIKTIDNAKEVIVTPESDNKENIS